MAEKRKPIILVDEDGVQTKAYYMDEIEKDGNLYIAVALDPNKNGMMNDESVEMAIFRVDRNSETDEETLAALDQGQELDILNLIFYYRIQKIFEMTPQGQFPFEFDEGTENEVEEDYAADEYPQIPQLDDDENDEYSMEPQISADSDEQITYDENALNPEEQNYNDFDNVNFDEDNAPQADEEQDYDDSEDVDFEDESEEDEDEDEDEWEDEEEEQYIQPPVQQPMQQPVRRPAPAAARPAMPQQQQRPAANPQRPQMPQQRPMAGERPKASNPQRQQPAQEPQRRPMQQRPAVNNPQRQQPMQGQRPAMPQRPPVQRQRPIQNAPKPEPEDDLFDKDIDELFSELDNI